MKYTIIGNRIEKIMVEHNISTLNLIVTCVRAGLDTQQWP